MANRPAREFLPTALLIAISIPCGNIAVREFRPYMDQWAAILVGSLIGIVIGLVVFGVTSWLMRDRRS